MSSVHVYQRYNCSPTILFVLAFIYFLGTCSSHYDHYVHYSSPEECARECKDGEPPRYCYYHFFIEYYTAMGPACNFCRPNGTNQLTNKPLCECIEADGIEKTVLSINRMIPGPSIQVCLYDKVVVDVVNEAEGLEVTLHWHGIFQNGYQYYDGVPYVTQCPIQSGTTFRYAFGADNSGTHMYHSHISVQMLDGQYGGFIVRDPPSRNPHYLLYDEDLPHHVMTVSDWMHELSIDRYPGTYRKSQGQTAESILVNGKGKLLSNASSETTNTPVAVFTVEYGKRYRFRLIGATSTVCRAKLSIHKHDVLVIAQDGENIEPVLVDTINFASGERVDFVLTANQEVKSYWMLITGTGECSMFQVYQVAILQYVGAPETPEDPLPAYDSFPMKNVYNTENAVQCDDDPTLKAEQGDICVNQLRSLEDPDPELMKVVPDHRLILPFWFYVYQLPVVFGPESFKRFMVAIDQSVVVSMIGEISHVDASSPPISQNEGYEMFCNPSHMPSRCTEPCHCTHVYHLKKGAVVEVVIYDALPQEYLSHPFHLHGYAYNVFTIGQYSDGRNITSADINEVIAKHEDRLARGLYEKPPAKDTLIVPQGGYTIVRFIANNPGWWLYHCHFLWHTVTGMDIVLHVGEPDDLPPVPDDFPQCNSWTPDPVFHKPYSNDN